MFKKTALRCLACATRTGGRIPSSLGLAVLRVAFGGMMVYFHGWDKLTHFGEKSGQFPDPLGIGSTASLTLVVTAEFFCSIAIALGLLTRITVIPLIIAMGVAAFVFHADDPWAAREKALLYLAACVTLLLCGAGRFSLDALIGRGATSEPESAHLN